MADADSRDVFKEPPLRYLGYANEVGEAFRHCVPVRLVHLTYLLASGYVLAHAVSRGYHWRDKPLQISGVRLPQSPSTHATPTHATPTHDTPTHDVLTHDTPTHATPTHAAVDTLVWQGLASVVLPGATINRVCWASRWALQGVGASPSVQRWAVVGVGLAVIPFIIHPIDRLVDAGMDSVRPWVKGLLTKDHSSTPVH